MRTGTLAVVGLALLVSGNSILGNTATDHLVHPYRDKDWGVAGYWSLLKKKLFLTPAKAGRILVSPSMGAFGEYTFAFDEDRDRSITVITYARASRNIWGTISDRELAPSRDKSTLQDWEKAPLRITRREIPLPSPTAAALRAAIAEMLRGTRDKWPGGELMAVDGTDFQFWLKKDGKTSTGVISPDMTGRNVSELRDLVGVLTKYCESLPERRSSVAQEIEKRAIRLSKRLETSTLPPTTH